MAKRGDNSQAIFWFLVDGARYAYFDMDYDESGSGSPSPTATIILQLTAGQIVRVENPDTFVIYGTDASGVIQTWFTGYMLHAL